MEPSYAPERFLGQFLGWYFVRVQLRLFRFLIDDVFVALVEILRRLGARRRAIHRVVFAQNRPGEIADAADARRHLRDRFGSRESRGAGRRRGRRRDPTGRGVRVHHRVNATTSRHAPLVILGIVLGVEDLKALVGAVQEVGDLFHHRAVHLPVRFDLRAKGYYLWTPDSFLFPSGSSLILTNFVFFNITRG